LSENHNTQTYDIPISRQVLTQNDNSRSLKVIYFGVNEKPLSDYVLQYNNYGLICKGLEHIASERSEYRHFRRLQSHLMPYLQRTFQNIRISVILLVTRIHAYISASDRMGLSSFKFLWLALNDMFAM